MAYREKIVDIKFRLKMTDLIMGRVVEDLIDILVQRGLLKYSDFSDEIRAKLKERDALREELKKLVELALEKGERISDLV